MNPLLNNLSQSAVDSAEISTALFASDKPDNPSSHEKSWIESCHYRALPF
ncbi:hypothetical protein CF65_01582 [Aggregatibacter actinomycetemcomitans HK1651]|nr:hypothetical protein [Aggregatibacter actinomycetemcomitans]AEW77253.1 hypothetical protein ANH9381_1285 [Aggregatibacter actinomycetemcomitans ANH9381]AHN71903.1 hypothetical protein CF65_01582 [Aggregatibacter actinomycetemcomitans HK1651]